MPSDKCDCEEKKEDTKKEEDKENDDVTATV